MTMKPTKNNVPQHIGIILDGNRRFAKRLMMKPWKGHEWGARKVEKLLGWCKDIGIKELTLYAFSIENFNRPKQEFDALMDLVKKEFNKYYSDERLEKEGICIRFIGRIHMFPKDIQELMNKLQEKTKNNKKYFVNFAMAYGGRAEIIDATKRIAEKVKQGKLDLNKINEEIFKKNIYLDSDPDLIIRTGGEKRISGFLLWQGSYAELFFLDKFWPEFEKEDLIQIVKEFQQRERRFGR